MKEPLWGTKGRTECRVQIYIGMDKGSRSFVITISSVLCTLISVLLNEVT